MTDSFATWLASLETDPASPSLLAVLGRRSGEIVCLGGSAELASALARSGPGARLRTDAERALAGRVTRGRFTLDLAQRPGATLDSLLVPLPPSDAGPDLALWIATDVSRGQRLRDACTDLGRRLVEATPDAEPLARQVARHVAHAVQDGRVEIWRLGPEGGDSERAERSVRFEVQPGPSTRPSGIDLGARAVTLRRGRPFPWDPDSPDGPLAVPIVIAGRAVGFLLVESGRPTPWTDEERCCLVEIAGLLASARRVDDRLEAERRASVRRTRAQLASMARGIAHDFNNLLVGILGGLELAFHDTPPDARRLREDLELVQRSATRASRLCQSMLAYSGGSQGRQRAVELNAIVRSVVDEELDGQPVLELDELLEPLWADPDHLHRLVACLVANAVEASDGRVDEVSVRTGRTDATHLGDESDWTLFPAHREGAFQLLEVRDRGHGIPAGALDRVFEPFFTTRPGATGLGLSMVIGLVESVGGGLRLSSALGRGTMVRVLFPLASELSAPAPRARGRNTGKTRVLVVDDDTSVLETLGRMLRASGCDVVEASDPLLAVDLFEHSEDPIDAVIVDVEMPVLDGVRTIERLRRIDPNIHAVLVSGYSAGPRGSVGGAPDPAGRREDAPAGASDASNLDPPVAFLQKPFSTADLLALLPGRGRASADGPPA